MTTTNTSARRTTKREYYNILLGIEAVNSNPELVAFIENEISLLDKKSNSSSEKKPTARQSENAGLKEAILNYLRQNDPATITELMKNVPELAAIENLTNQRTSAIVRQMVEIDKTVERLVEKRTAYFKAI